MKKPRRLASASGAGAPLEVCHADSTGAGVAGRDSEPLTARPQVSVRVAIRTINPLNHREHWRARSRRVKAERTDTAWSLLTVKRPALPVVVLFTREAMREMDTDGLAASFKGVRDQVAEWLGVDDADRRVEWRYDQRKAKGFNVLIEIKPAPQ